MARASAKTPSWHGKIELGRTRNHAQEGSWMKTTRSRQAKKAQSKAHKRRLREKLARQARSAERRLRDAVAPNFGGTVIGRANIVYEIAERTRAVAHGGMGLITRLVKAVGLAEEVDSSLQLLKLHRPYHEPDHVLNIAYNALCGGHRLDDIELRRRDQVFLDGIGAASLPDPTTAGDFCRRFDEGSIIVLLGEGLRRLPPVSTWPAHT